MKRVRGILIVATAVCTILAVSFLPRFIRYVERERVIAEQEGVNLPTAETSVFSSATAVSSSASSIGASSTVSSARAAVNWDIPFTSQAPLANWDALHGEACEEASILMVLRYFRGLDFSSPEEADAAIVALVKANEDLGFAIDDTAAEMQTLIVSQDSSLETSLLKNPTVQDIKSALSDGKLIIVPLAGRQLGNPYYRQPGPLYHVLVLRGYTADGKYVITNDPGTKRGEAYVYTWETLLGANHDWNGGDVERGEKVMLVVGRK